MIWVTSNLTGTFICTFRNIDDEYSGGVYDFYEETSTKFSRNYLSHLHLLVYTFQNFRSVDGFLKLIKSNTDLFKLTICQVNCFFKYKKSN